MILAAPEKRIFARHRGPRLEVPDVDDEGDVRPVDVVHEPRILRIRFLVVLLVAEECQLEPALPGATPAQPVTSAKHNAARPARDRIAMGPAKFLPCILFSSAVKMPVQYCNCVTGEPW